MIISLFITTVNLGMQKKGGVYLLTPLELDLAV